MKQGKVRENIKRLTLKLYRTGYNTKKQEQNEEEEKFYSKKKLARVIEV